MSIVVRVDGFGFQPGDHFELPDRGGAQASQRAENSAFDFGDLCVSISFSCASPERERLSTVKKKSAVLKRAMTEKRERWQNKEYPAGEDGGQSSHDTLKISQPQGKWKEICAEIDAVGKAVSEKRTGLHKMFEAAVMNENKSKTKEERSGI